MVKKSPGPFHSRKQQSYVYGVLAKRNPKVKTWAKRWATAVGETGPHGNKASSAAWHALPARKGIRKRA
jgi:hypothetical protein